MADQVHRLGGQAQHPHGSPLDGAYRFTGAVQHPQLLVAPGAAHTPGAQGIGQRIQRGSGAVRWCIQYPGRCTLKLLI